MIKKIFLAIIIFLQINLVNGNFEFDKEYLSEKIGLEYSFKDDSNKKFLEYCLAFGKKFFPEELHKKACIIQFLSIAFGNKIFKENEEIFYKENRKKILEIAFGGDIMLSRTVGFLNKKNGYDRIFKDFHPNKIFSENTILFYNLESPFSEIDKDIDERSFIFKANTKNIEVLKNLSQNRKTIFSLANNHITNAGGKGIDTTINLLDKNNFFHIGVGKEKPEIKEINQNGVKTCFSAYTYDGKDFFSKDGNSKVQKYFINPILKEDIFFDLEKMYRKSCDFKIISLHWGAEYKIKPSQNQKKLAHEIIDSGADLILGHHSHIPGETEIYKGKYIYYSLGNFIFDQNWGKTFKDKNMDTFFDEKLKKNTIPTYIGNTFYHKYEIIGKNIKLLENKNIKHRIDNGKLEKY